MVVCVHSATQQELGLLIVAPAVLVASMAGIQQISWPVLGLAEHEPFEFTTILLYALVVCV